jgi:menaquinone-dependent protoporphyrinogen oxidase
MSAKVLIVYGTRFGATTGTAEEIANVMRKEGLEVKVANLKKEKIKDISSYDLIIVGSGMMIGRWTGEPQKFLRRFQKQLAGKKVALFVSSGGLKLLEVEGKTDEIASTRKKYLEDKALLYNLKPIAMEIFGGVWDMHHIPWWSGMAMKAIQESLKKSGLKESKPGVYDTRDWDAIRNWAKELAKKVT